LSHLHNLVALVRHLLHHMIVGLGLVALVQHHRIHLKILKLSHRCMKLRTQEQVLVQIVIHILMMMGLELEQERVQVQVQVVELHHNCWIPLEQGQVQGLLHHNCWKKRVQSLLREQENFQNMTIG
jgi:hypothetical protein